MGDPSTGRKLYSVLMFVFVSALGGLLIAGLAVPTAGLATEITRAGANALTSIPAELETPPQSEASTVLMGDGTTLTSFYEENRTYVSLDEISPIMQQALISVEDQRFYEHGALDLRGTLRALVRTSAGNTQGGSTLTQQYVKLALLDEAIAEGDAEAKAAAYDRTFARKLLELRYAISLEQTLTKDQILERYLNLVYFGKGAYGVEAAAHRYWGTTAAKLNLAQAAMLAGVVRNPATTDPIDNTKIAIERRNNVLTLMEGQGVITADEATKARDVGYNKKKAVTPTHGCVDSDYPHLCDVVYRTLTHMKSLGTTTDERVRTLTRGGLTIQTEIDRTTQDAAQKAVSDYIYAKDPVIGMMVMIEPGTGLIKAVAQSKEELGSKAGQSWYNYPMEPSLGGGDGFRGGSTFKMFTTTAAIAKGYPASRTYTAPRSKNWTGQQFTSCDGSFTQGSRWVVDGYPGSGDMYWGAKHSVNNYFVALEQDVGICDVTTMAQKLGLHISEGGGKTQTELFDEKSHYPSFTLGAAEVSPISVANAAATLAARGKRCTPHILSSVTGADGKDYAVPDANCEQVIDQDVADRVNDILRGPFTAGGTAQYANIPGYHIAGKTGTDNGTPTIWTVGFTPELVGVATITVDKTSKRYKDVNPDRQTLVGAPVRGGTAYLRGYSGSEAGAGIWKPAMTVALKTVPNTDFVAPSAYHAKTVSVPSCSGMSVSSCQSTLRAAGFSTSISKITNDSPAGTFLGTSPKGSAEQYSNITLYVSSGPAQVATSTPKPSASSSTASNNNGNGNNGNGNNGNGNNGNG